jgi:hypothetical protein
MRRRRATATARPERDDLARVAIRWMLVAPSPKMLAGSFTKYA